MPGDQQDGGHEEFVLRSVHMPGSFVPEKNEAAFPVRAQTLQFILEAGFERTGALAPVRQEEQSALGFLRQQIGARFAAEEEEETARRAAMAGLLGYASNRREGAIRELFLANVAEASGRASIEMCFAQMALVTTGDYAGCLEFGDNLGQGAFGRVDQVTRRDFPRIGPLALKTIDEVHNRSQSSDVPVFRLRGVESNVWGRYR